MIRKIISSIKIFEFELRKIDNGIVSRSLTIHFTPQSHKNLPRKLF